MRTTRSLRLLAACLLFGLAAPGALFLGSASRRPPRVTPDGGSLELERRTTYRSPPRVERPTVAQSWEERANRPFVVPVRLELEEACEIELGQGLRDAFRSATSETETLSPATVERRGNKLRLHFPMDTSGEHTRTILLHFGPLPPGSYGFGGGQVVLADPRLPGGRLRAAAPGHSYFQALKGRHFRNPTSWRVVEGEFPPGLELVGHVVWGTPLPASGRYSFVVEATDDDGATAAARYEITMEQRETRLMRAWFTDTDQDRRVGAGDVVVLHFDGVVLPQGRTGVDIGLEQTGASLGTGPRLRSLGDSHAAELVLGLGASMRFTAEGPMLTMGTSAFTDSEGSPLGPARVVVRESLPIRSFHWSVGQEVVGCPVTAIDQADDDVWVRNVPADIRLDGGRLFGTLRGPPSARQTMVVGRGHMEIGWVSYEVKDQAPDARLRIRSVAPRDAFVGDLIRIDLAEPPSEPVRIWLNDTELTSELPAPPGTKLMFLEEGSYSGQLTVYAWNRRSTPTPIAVRDTVPRMEAPHVTATRVVRVAQRSPVAYVVFRGHWLTGADGSGRVQVHVDGEPLEPIVLTCRFGAVRLPDAPRRGDEVPRVHVRVPGAR